MTQYGVGRRRVIVIIITVVIVVAVVVIVVAQRRDLRAVPHDDDGVIERLGVARNLVADRPRLTVGARRTAGDAVH